MWAMSKAFVCFAWGLEKNLFIVWFHYPNNTNSRAGKSYERSELDLDAKSLRGLKRFRAFLKEKIIQPEQIL
jgi:hypothetical protein